MQVKRIRRWSIICCTDKMRTGKSTGPAGWPSVWLQHYYVWFYKALEVWHLHRVLTISYSFISSFNFSKHSGIIILLLLIRYNQKKDWKHVMFFAEDAQNIFLRSLVVEKKIFRNKQHQSVGICLGVWKLLYSLWNLHMQHLGYLTIHHCLFKGPMCHYNVCRSPGSNTNQMWDAEWRPLSGVTLAAHPRHQPASPHIRHNALIKGTGSINLVLNGRLSCKRWRITSRRRHQQMPMKV